MERNFRRNLVKEGGLKGFCAAYLPHYFTLPQADFHPELIHDLDDWSEENQYLAREGFRGSAKSSLAVTALILYAALEDKTKFIIPINETDDVVKLTIAGLREELERNQNIKKDYGDLIKKNASRQTAFNEKNIVLQNGCRVMGRSRGQKIRGLKHNQHRVGLVVADDIEEAERVAKKEYRDKTERWLRGTVIPAIEEGKGRLVVLGNKLHTDAIMERLKKIPIFKYREYPLIDPITNECTWKGKYPTQESLDRQRAKVGEAMWQREYLLKVLPPEGQDVKADWIQYYDDIPVEAEVGLHGTGVDLAISQKETADYTTMVSGVTAMINDLPKIYIKPFPINAHLTFHETIETAKNMAQLNPLSIFFVEQVAYQLAAIQEMERQMIPVVPMQAGGDKRARLRAIAIYIQNGTIQFPRYGCEDLITQLLGFGIESHDDLVDAFVYLILGLVQQNMQNPEVRGLF